jgi:hypothetical protein
LLFGEVKLLPKKVTEEKEKKILNNMAQSKFDTKYLKLIFNLGTSIKNPIYN